MAINGGGLLGFEMHAYYRVAIGSLCLNTFLVDGAPQLDMHSNRVEIPGVFYHVCFIPETIKEGNVLLSRRVINSLHLFHVHTASALS